MTMMQFDIDINLVEQHTGFDGQHITITIADEVFLVIFPYT